VRTSSIKRRKRVTALLAAGAMLAAGCGSSGKANSSGTTAGQTPSTAAAAAGEGASAPGVTSTTINILATHCLTGTAAAVCHASYAAYAAAADVINAKGGIYGRKLKFNVVDDSGGASELQGELNTDANHNLLLASLISGDTEIDAQYGDQHQIPGVYGDIPGSYLKNSSYAFTVLPTFDTQASTLLPSLVKKTLGTGTKIAVTYDNNPEAEGAAPLLASSAKTYGLSVVSSQELTSTQANCDDQAANAKSAGAKAIVLLNNDPLTAICMIKSVKSISGYNPLILGPTSSFGSNELVQALGVSTLQGARVIGQGGTAETPAGQAYTAAMLAAGNPSADAHNDYGYITFAIVNVIAQALKVAGPNPTRANVLAALQHGMTGYMSGYSPPWPAWSQGNNTGPTSANLWGCCQNGAWYTVQSNFVTTY
jgi:branched-chain amino acid transport system substrate-binding protein